MKDLEKMADMLVRAQAERIPCAKLTEQFVLDVKGAYEVQALNIQRRLGSGLHGQVTVRVGRKIGLTSEAIQSWLHVNEPDFGTLLDDMVVPDGGAVDTSLLLQPRAEAEVAFIMGKDLKGPGITMADVILATEFIAPAIEIIDSRIAEWKIAYEDTIADNASSGLFVVGSSPKRLADVNLRTCGMTLAKNGRVVSTGAGAACLGHPVNALVWLANKLGSLGEGIKAGDIVLSGALGPVTPVLSGDALTAKISGLGSVTVRFK